MLVPEAVEPPTPIPPAPGLFNVSFTVNVAVSEPAALSAFTLLYATCSRPCSAHLIKSDALGISAPTILKKDEMVRLPYLSNSFS